MGFVLSVGRFQPQPMRHEPLSNCAVSQCKPTNAAHLSTIATKFGTGGVTQKEKHMCCHQNREVGWKHKGLIFWTLCQIFPGTTQEVILKLCVFAVENKNCCVVISARLCFCAPPQCLQVVIGTYKLRQSRCVCVVFRPEVETFVVSFSLNVELQGPFPSE